MAKRRYGLEIRYNDNNPLYCFSAEPAGVGAQLYTDIDNSLNLSIYVKETEERLRYDLKKILPGDQLRLRYLDDKAIQSSNIDEIKTQARMENTLVLEPGFKIGLDVKLKSSKLVRVSHPDRGSFQLILGNIPLDHARVQFMAGNHTEEWHWQFPDLYPNEEIILEVVKTNWNDSPPSVEPRV